MNSVTVRPAVDRDLDDQAYFYATSASADLGHRFLVNAHQTFTILAANPLMGWKFTTGPASWRSLRVFPVEGFDRIPILYAPHPNGVEIVRVVHGSRNLVSFLRRHRPD